MASRRIAALAALVLLIAAAPSSAAARVEPRAGVLLSGAIQFPREQKMSIQTMDGTRLAVAMGFDGRCKGGGLGEVWASNVPVKQDVRVRDGRFAATLTGVARNLGNGRSGHFRWRVTGRFLEPDVAVATVTGSGEVRVDGRTISRCKIAAPATVRLAIRSAD